MAGAADSDAARGRWECVVVEQCRVLPYAWGCFKVHYSPFENDDPLLRIGVYFSTPGVLFVVIVVFEFFSEQFGARVDHAGHAPRRHL